MRHFWFSLLLWTAVVAQPLAAQEQEVGELGVGSRLQQRLEHHIEMLDTLHREPIGILPLTELERNATWYPAAVLLEPLQELWEQPDTDPLLRAFVAHRLAWAHYSSGDLAASEQLLVQQGYLTVWSVTGPFPNDAMAGFDTVYEPEQVRGPDQVYTGRLGTTQWRDVSGLTVLGYLDLGRLAQPAHSAVVYAAAELNSPRATEARLWTAVDGAFKVWLNGALVARLDTDLGGGPIREWWELRLEQGVNRLVVKTGGESGPLGFTMRLTAIDGSALDGLTVSSQIAEDHTILQQQEAVTHSGSVRATLEEAILSAEGSILDPSEVRAGVALILQSAQPRDPTEPWRRHASQAETCTTGTATALYWCSLVQDQYWERHRSLQRAVEQTPPSDPLWPWLQEEMARLYLGGVGEDLARQAHGMVEELIRACPDFVPGLLLQARILEVQRFYWRARQVYEQALEQAPQSPEVLFQVAAAWQESGAPLGLIDLYDQLVALRMDETTPFLWLVPALVRQGRVEEANARLEGAIRANPLSMHLLQLQANLLLSEGDEDGALAALERMVSLFPTSALAFEELGRFRVRQRELVAADEAFARALAIEPQNQDLAEYRRSLQAETGWFYQPFVVDRARFGELLLPDEMSADRDYYYLVDQEIHLVHANGLGTRFVQQVFQVQTRHGADSLRQYYVEFTPDEEVVNMLTARIIKPDGRISEVFRSREESLSQPWYGLYYDLRALVFFFEDLAVGDILEIQYTLSGTSTRNLLEEYFGDFWFVQEVQPKSLARYGVIYPATMRLSWRYPSLNHQVSRQETPQGMAELIELREVPHIEPESSMPGFSSVADHIHVSSFSSWGDVSAWYWNLIKDQLVSSPDIEATVERLMAGLTTTEQRVQAIHEWVVRNMRYVGLEFGIHGFKPYRTSIAFARRFGDCKDTAALMKVMLELAGIDSHLVLVRTSNQGTVGPHPASLAVFNHAILYVPELDLYLDGTTGHAGWRELPSPDQGASALIVLDGRDHRFVTLPFLPSSSNQMEYRFEVDLTATNSPATGFIRASGQFAPLMRQRYEAVQQQMEEFEKEFRQEYPGAELSSLEFSNLQDITRPVEITFEFSGVSWTRPVDGALVMTALGVESSFSSRYAGSASRRQPLYLGPPFRLSYAIDYRLPEGMAAIPSQPSRQVVTPFGRFDLRIEQGEGMLAVNVELEITATLVAVNDYAAFRAFLVEAVQVINSTIRLVPIHQR